MVYKKKIKLLFIIVLIVLPFQYGVVGIVGYYQSEPWPAFVFPGFKSVYHFEGGFEISQTEFHLFREDEQEPVRLSPQQLFPELPLSQVPGFIRTHFSDPEQIEQYGSEIIHWLKNQAQQQVHVRPNRVEVADLTEFYSIRNGQAIRDSVRVENRTTVGVQ